MEHHTSLLSLTIVVAIAFIIPITLQRFRLNAIPVVVAEIVAGILVGQSGLNIVEPNIWLEVLSTMGFIFLMFLSGLEIDFNLFRQKKKNNHEPHSFLIATIIFILIFIFSYVVSGIFVVLGFVSDKMFMTLIISTISLGVVVPSLKENNVSKTVIGQTILLTAVIADLVTMILLAIFVGLNSPDGQNMWLLLLLFATGLALYAIAKRMQNLPYLEGLRRGSVQIDTRAIFALILLLVGLSEQVGAENILGAFLAGVLVSLLSPKYELMEKLESIGYGFFIPIFFVMVGINLQLWSIFDNTSSILIIPLLVLSFFITKLIPCLVLKKWYDWNVVLGTSFLLTSTLSLVIAATNIGERLRIIEESLAAALVLSAVITCIFAPILFNKVFSKPEEVPKRVSIIGTERTLMTLALQLKHEGYNVSLFTSESVTSNIGKYSKHSLTLHSLADLSVHSLVENGALLADYILVATNQDSENYEIGLIAKANEVEHVIVHLEDVELQKLADEAGISVFSTRNAEQFLFKTMVINPSIYYLLQKHNDTMREVKVKKYGVDGVAIKELPHLGDLLILQIVRGNQYIIPHGSTILRYNDVLLLTGHKEEINQLEQFLQ